MLRLTRQRLAVLGALERGAQAFPWILAALDTPLEHARKDYARVHRVIMELVRERIVSHHKTAMHNCSLFSLTPAGQALVEAYRRKHEHHLQLLRAASPSSDTPNLPSPLQVSSPPKGPAPGARPAIKCPECGDAISIDRARDLIGAGFKVACKCGLNLTSLARDAIALADEKDD